MGKYDKYVAEYGGAEQDAQANIHAAQDVGQPAAVGAFKAAPVTRVDPSVAMADPIQTKALHSYVRDSDLARSVKSIGDFAATSPAHVAATREDWPKFANIAFLAQAWADAKAPLEGAIKGLEEANAAPANSFPTAVGKGFQSVMAVANTVGAAAFTPFAPIFKPAARGIAADVPLAKQTSQTNPFGANIAESAMLGLMGKMGVFKVPTLDPATAAQAYENALFASVSAVPFLGLRVPRAGKGVVPVEPPPVTARPVGGVTPPQGPVKPPGVQPQDNAVHQQIAKADAEHVAVIQEHVADTATHGDIPEVSAEFLSHTPLANDHAWVDTDTLQELYAQGHTPFASMGEAVQSALESGSALKVPLSVYTAETAGQPYAEVLNSTTRFREDGVSVEEGKALPQPTEGGEPVTVPREVTHPEDVAADVSRELPAQADAAVEEVFAEQALPQLFTDKKALGLTQAQFDRYDAMLSEAKAAATDRILQRTYDQIRHERTPDWKDQVKRESTAVEEGVFNDPVHAARMELQYNEGPRGEPLEKPPIKFDEASAISAFGQATVDALPSSMFRKTGGFPVDTVAQELGYRSGEDLLLDLLGQQERAQDGEGYKALVKREVKAGAEAAARKELGYDISPAGLEAAAREAAAGLPQLEDFLETGLKEFAEKAGLPFSKEDVQFKAKQTFDALLVKDAASVKSFERNMWTLGNKTEAALGEGNFVKAFKFRQLQMQNFYQLKMAHEFRRELARGTKTLRGWARADTVPGTDPVIGAVLQKEAMERGYGEGRDTAELDRFLDTAKEQGLETTVPGLAQAANDAGYPIPETPILPSQIQTVADYRDMMNTLNGIQKFGKEIHEVQVGEATWQLTALTNEVQANADALTRKYTAQELVNARDSAYKRLALSVKSILLNNWSPEKFLSWMDGEKQGPLMKGVVNPLQEGKYTETGLINDWIKAMRSAVSNEYLRNTDTKLSVPESVPEVGDNGYTMVPMSVNTAHGKVFPIDTRGKLRTALLHLGSETARERLLKGFDWGPGQEKWIIDNATSEDWAFARAFWDQNEVLFKQADAMYGRVRGYGLVKDEPRTVYDRDGNPHQGGHVHVKYDGTLSVLRQLRATAEGVQATTPNTRVSGAMDNQHPTRALPSAFYGLERTHVGRPVDLNPRGLSAGVSEVIHDISFREAVIQAQKILADGRVKEAMMTTMGPEYQAQMAPWLNYIAKDRTFHDPATEAAAQVIRSLSSNFIFSKVAFNINSTMKHSLIGLSHITRVVGNPAIVAEAGKDLMTNGKYWTSFIDQMSGEVRGLAWTLDANMQEGLAEDALTGGRLRAARQIGFYMFSWSKIQEARVTWLSVYRREIAAHGNTPDAVNSANKAVRETQGASGSVDLPTFRRKAQTWEGEIMRNTLGLLMGFKGTTANAIATMSFSLRQAGVEMGQGNFAGAGKQAGRASGYIASYIIGAALLLAAWDVFVRGGGDPRKSKADAFTEELGWGLADQTAGSFVGLNRIVESAHYGADDHLNTLIKQGEKSLETGEVSEKEVTGALKLTGGVLGWPTDSMVNLGAAGYDAVTGEYPLASPTFVQRGVLGRQGNEGGSGTPVQHRQSRPRRPSAKEGHK